MPRLLLPALVGLALLGAPVRPLGAQRPVTVAPQLELRAGSTLAPRPAPHLGVGVNLRAGWYARLGGALELGATRVGDRWEGSQRATVSARFLLDPFRERHAGLYGGAGLAVRRVGEGSPEGALLLLVGIEGRAPARGFVPAFELAIGGGVHATLILRRSRTDSR